MSDNFREFIDSREPFVPDAAAAEDWEEFAAYVEGGFEAIMDLDRKRINLELNAIGTSLNMMTGQVESLYSLKGRVDHFVTEQDGNVTTRLWSTKTIDKLGSPRCIQCIAAQIANGNQFCGGTFGGGCN